MSIEANKEIVRAFYAQAATGERDEELVAAGLGYHGPDMLGDLQGRDAFVQVLSGFRSAFPGFETDVHHLVAEGDTVAVWHTHRGTHTGEFAGVPATGMHVIIN
jgi:predicted ester cyclase